MTTPSTPPAATAPAPRLSALPERAPWRVLDVTIAAISMYAAHRLSPTYLADPTATPALQVSLVHVGAMLAAGHAVGLYEPAVARSRSLARRRGVAAGTLAVLATLLFFYVVRYAPIGRWIAALGWLGTTGGVLLGRELAHRRGRAAPRVVLFVHEGPLVRATVEALARVGDGAFRVLPPVHESASRDERAGERLRDLCAAGAVDDLVVPNANDALEPWLRPALGCLELGCRLLTEADFYEEVLERVPVEHVPADWLLSRGWDTSDPWREVAKRATDVAIALAVTPLALPLAAAAALAIRLDDRGPALFPQRRIGRFGQPFTMWKLRTMKAGAEAGSARWTAAGDPRLTRVGRRLRVLRLDELPQLLNVLRGEMSWVGPRPEQPEIVAELERRIPYYAWRHQVRPGLTGWAQLKLPYASSVEEARHKLELDLYYIRHRSWWLDLGIVLRTVTSFARGAR